MRPAPGSGTWRRNPDAKWRLRPGSLDVRPQGAGRGARPGGAPRQARAAASSTSPARSCRRRTTTRSRAFLAAPAAFDGPGRQEVLAAAGLDGARRPAVRVTQYGLQLTPARDRHGRLLRRVLLRARIDRPSAAGRSVVDPSAHDAAADKTPTSTRAPDQRRHDKILIVDFGSQVTQLIARRVREEGVYCEIEPFQKAGEAFRSA